MAGMGEKIKGVAEKVWGNVTGDPNTKLQGELHKAEGQAKHDAARMGHSDVGSGFGTASDTTGTGYGTSDARGTSAYGTVTDSSMGMQGVEGERPSVMGGMAQTAKGYAEKGMGYVTGDPARQLHGESDKLGGQAEREAAHQHKRMS